MPSDDRYPPRYPLSALLLPLLLFAILVAVLLWRFWPGEWFDSSGIDPNATPRAITPRGSLADDEKTATELFKQSAPTVVHITTLSVGQGPLSFDLLQIPRGTGSGFVWDDQGHIVTNYHVIQGADAANVTLNDHSTWTARLVGAYADQDLAVLIINAPKNKLPPIPVGSSQDLQVGQKVFAIGNPFGLDQSLTTGIISAVGRQIESVTRRPIKEMIQTDAAINPGNSGGPLLDSAGRLIGVNTAIYSPSGAYAGIGFAIPVDTVNRVVPQLIRYGKVKRPRLGMQPLPDRETRRLGLDGVVVLGVEPGGPAEKAGLRPTRRDETGNIKLGDVILAVDGQKVRSANDLLDQLESKEAGSPVELTILRDGEVQKTKVMLEEAE